jgi:hypothetical protein
VIKFRLGGLVPQTEDSHSSVFHNTLDLANLNQVIP